MLICRPYERLAEAAGTSPPALEFAILTAARTSEVLGARWEEFDLDRGVWMVPADPNESRPRTPGSAVAAGTQDREGDV